MTDTDAVAASGAAGTEVEGTSVPQPFVGHVERLDRLAVVPPGRLVWLVGHEGSRMLLKPGDLLVPHPLSPFRRTELMQINAEPITLTVCVKDLGSSDIPVRTIAQVDLEAHVRINAENNYAALFALAKRNGAALGQVLLQDVQNGLELGLRAAVRSHGFEYLKSRSLIQVLQTGSWLPTSFAGRALLLEGFRVPSIIWSQAELAAIGPADMGTAVPPPRLWQDPSLQAIWQDLSTTRLFGIAGALREGTATVIAATEKGARPSRRTELEQLFSDCLGASRTKLVITPADSYTSLITSWYAQVGDSIDQVVSVDPAGDDGPVRVVLNLPLSATLDTDGAELAALRQLLTPRRVEFWTRGDG